MEDGRLLRLEDGRRDMGLHFFRPSSLVHRLSPPPSNLLIFSPSQFRPLQLSALSIRLPCFPASQLIVFLCPAPSAFCSVLYGPCVFYSAHQPSNLFYLLIFAMPPRLALCHLTFSSSNASQLPCFSFSYALRPMPFTLRPMPQAPPPHRSFQTSAVLKTLLKLKHYLGIPPHRHRIPGT